MKDMKDAMDKAVELTDDALNDVSGGAGPSMTLPKFRGFTAVFSYTATTSAAELAGMLSNILRQRGFIWTVNSSIFHPILSGNDAGQVRIVVNDSGVITEVSKVV